MGTQTIPICEIIEKLPAGSTLTLRNVSWEEYEALREDLGDASGRRLSYDQGTLQIFTLSSEHESYRGLVEKLVALLSARPRVRVLSFGSSTMKRKEDGKVSEPHACCYVQTAPVIAPYYLSNPPRPGLLFGYGNLDEKEIIEGVRRFARLP